MHSVDPEQSRRVELLIHQLDSLPTLSAVATRLLELTAAENPRRVEVAALVASDPALTAKLLRLCHCGIDGRTGQITTAEAAIEHLGFDAVRSAVMSVQALELFDRIGSCGGERRDEPTFCREAFWEHSLAVAVLCELLAEQVNVEPRIDPAEAFTAGLLHDLGVLALHVVLPQSFDRAVRSADSGGLTLDATCRQIVGVTTHAAGRRLAEHWRLPHMIGDVLWLHGQPASTLPTLRHKHVIELVTLADAAARARFAVPLGHGPRGEDLVELAKPLAVSTETLENIIAEVPDHLATRSETLGLASPPDPDQMLEALSRANESMGRMIGSAQQRGRKADEFVRTLSAITEFHDAAAPGGSVVAVLGKVARSARAVLGGGFFAMLYQARKQDPWQVMRFASDGRLIGSQVMYPPSGSTAVSDLADHMQVSMEVLGMLPWLHDYLGATAETSKVRLLPLRCGWGVNAVLIHDGPGERIEDRQQMEALSRTWAATIAAASHHTGAKKLGEQLAESHRALLETRGELTRREKLASLGEIAAGAAHEMNNPLTVISGRAQILANRLESDDYRNMAKQISEQSHRLSDMISTLRSFAEPIEPEPRPVDLRDLLEEQVQSVYRDHGDAVRIKVVADPSLPQVHVDPGHIGRAVLELLRNAAESEGSSDIELRVQIDPVDDRLQVQVVDDGAGLSKHALAHAFDPFFSVKSAGRQPGLGLAHARRLIEAHGGRIRLKNGRQRGAVAGIGLSRWRVPEVEREVA
jgi:signal transduction histidine kinase/HD-like signal output (HDOD) protein